jgi:predicted MFS family arabinose efflux permease
VALALGILAIPGVPLDGLGALPLLVPFGLGLGLLFVPASRAALNAVPQAKHGRVSSLLSASRLLGAGLGAVLGGVALSGGVTDEHMRIALGAGAVLCLVVGLPAAIELSNRSAAATLDSRRPGSRGGAASQASRSRR